ncbi:hypothetical protein, partial [Ferruginibacter sp.]
VKFIVFILTSPLTPLQRRGNWNWVFYNLKYLLLKDISLPGFMSLTLFISILMSAFQAFFN